jgi:hypothetical protein
MNAACTVTKADQQETKLEHEQEWPTLVLRYNDDRKVKVILVENTHTHTHTLVPIYLLLPNHTDHQVHTSTYKSNTCTASTYLLVPTYEVADLPLHVLHVVRRDNASQVPSWDKRVWQLMT